MSPLLLPGRRALVTSRPAADAPAGNGLKTSLSAWWDFQEDGGNFLDSHTNGLALTRQNGAATHATGKIGRCVDLELDTSQYLSRASHADLSPEAGTFGVSVWFKRESTTGDFGVVCKYETSASLREWIFLLIDQGGGAATPRFSVYEADGSAANHRIWDTNITDTNWHHAAMGIDGSNRLWLQIDNGTRVVTNRTVTPTATSGQFFVGRVPAHSWQFDGLIDQLGVWKGRAGGLSEADVTALYNAGAGLAYADLTS